MSRHRNFLYLAEVRRGYACLIFFVCGVFFIKLKHSSATPWSLRFCQTIVLDEADKMCDQGMDVHVEQAL